MSDTRDYDQPCPLCHAPADQFCATGPHREADLRDTQRAANIATERMHRAEDHADMLSHDCEVLLVRVRALEAGLRGALAYDGHVFNCPAKLESAASGDCSPRCQAARAALDGEG